MKAARLSIIGVLCLAAIFLSIPSGGVPSKPVGIDELEKVMDDAQEAIKSGK